MEMNVEDPDTVITAMEVALTSPRANTKSDPKPPQECEETYKYHHRLVITKDLQKLVCEEDGITRRTNGLVHAFQKKPDNPYELEVAMHGPVGSPYCEGIFMLYIQLPYDYPFEPPIVKFQTRCWHPNVGTDDGIVYLDFLTDGRWSPAWNLTTLLLAVFSVLSDPVVSDDKAANQEAAYAYQNNRNQYRSMAQHQTRVYACPDATEQQENAMLDRLVEMGFARKLARKVLVVKGWNVDEAVLELVLRGAEEATSQSSHQAEAQPKGEAMLVGNTETQACSNDYPAEKDSGSCPAPEINEGFLEEPSWNNEMVPKDDSEEEYSLMEEGGRLGSDSSSENEYSLMEEGRLGSDASSFVLVEDIDSSHLVELEAHWEAGDRIDISK